MLRVYHAKDVVRHNKFALLLHKCLPSLLSHVLVKVTPGGQLSFTLIYWPERSGQHYFQLPLSLEGIPPDVVGGLGIPVTATGLKPTLIFDSTELDFGSKVVSRDPCALKQYQGEFLLKNASEKASQP